MTNPLVLQWWREKLGPFVTLSQKDASISQGKIQKYAKGVAGSLVDLLQYSGGRI